MKCKMNGAKTKNSIMGPQSHRYVGNVQWTKEGYSRSDPAGPSRDIKRKMSPPKVRNKAQGDCSATEVEGFKELKGLVFSSLSPKSDENGKKGIKMEKPKVTNKPSPQASVKGKKALARSRKTSNGVDNRDNPSDPQAANMVLLPTSVPRSASSNGKSVQGAITSAQFASSVASKQGGGGSEDHSCRGSCVSEMGLELGLATEVESMEDDVPVNQSRYDEGCLLTGGIRMEGQAQSVVGMLNRCAGYEFSSEESSDATGLGLKGDGKALMSY